MRNALLAIALFPVIGAAACGEEALGARPPHGLCTSSQLDMGPLRWLVCGIGALALLFFLHGLFRRRHDWKPLVLGLFGLGFGLLDMLTRAIAGLSFMLGISRYAGADCVELAMRSLVSAWMGLTVLLAGGLFTVILRWRNERFRSTQAGAKAAPSGE